MHRTVLVCQHDTCSQQGAAQVLAAFQQQFSNAVTITSSGCLGQCGSGPMVLVLPEETWYCHIRPPDVPIIVEEHLNQGRIVTQKLYPKFHPTGKSVEIWLTAFGVTLVLLALLLTMLARQTYYLHLSQVS